MTDSTLRQSDEPPERVERFGPLALRRHVKDDGRALLLYEQPPLPRTSSEHTASAPAGGADGGRARGGGTPGGAPRSPAGAAETAGSGQRGAHELRFSELRGEQVVYAIDRQERTFLPPAEHCPLCPTRPGGEPTEIPFPAFQIAVFENRFPAFEPPAGAAEVVVYTDSHGGSFGTLAPARARALMWVWRQRYLELGEREDVEYVYIFENRGVEVGVTLHHPHGQIYAYPFLPPVPRLELAADARLGGCAPCALLRDELADGRRVVHENDQAVVFVPRAARWAYEAHVVMRAHRASLLACEPAELDGLAEALQALVRGYDALFQRPFPYVLAVHQAPVGNVSAGGASADDDDGGDSGDGGGHLHVELYPPLRTATKLKYLAGSEQGAGTFISDTLPEESAGSLRKAIADAG
jgi:UDPglucose--hexose-1-phosphate uridylyltransferase